MNNVQLDKYSKPTCRRLQKKWKHKRERRLSKINPEYKPFYNRYKGWN